MTHISQFKVFDGLTAEDHVTIIQGWINDIPAEEVSVFLNMNEFLVKAYYGVRDLMFYEAECMPEGWEG
jgi:hypothetical protein